jgi:hypothetical protein
MLWQLAEFATVITCPDGIIVLSYIDGTLPPTHVLVEFQSPDCAEEITLLMITVSLLIKTPWL